MSRRLLAAAAAVILAAFGAVVLLTYAGNADARARAGEQLVPVLVVTSTVKAGTAAGAMADDVATQQVPRRLAVTGTLTSLTAVQGKVANTDLLPGEQLLAGRFTDPSRLPPCRSDRRSGRDGRGERLARHPAGGGRRPQGR